MCALRELSVRRLKMKTYEGSFEDLRRSSGRLQRPWPTFGRAFEDPTKTFEGLPWKHLGRPLKGL
jgi:hypothetical protein